VAQFLSESFEPDHGVVAVRPQADRQAGSLAADILLQRHCQIRPGSDRFASSSAPVNAAIIAQVMGERKRREGTEFAVSSSCTL
jgi:hypothetical protein